MTESSSVHSLHGFATPLQMFFWDMAVLLFSTFSSLYLVVGLLVLTRPASNPEFLICFADWRIGERRFPFLSKLGAIRYYGSCFLFCFLQLSLLL
jgi:hypothetical protein